MHDRSEAETGSVRQSWVNWGFISGAAQQPKAFPGWGSWYVRLASHIWGKKGRFLKVRMEQCDQQKHMRGHVQRAKALYRAGGILCRGSEESFPGDCELWELRWQEGTGRVDTHRANPRASVKILAQEKIRIPLSL